MSAATSAATLLALQASQRAEDERRAHIESCPCSWHVTPDPIPWGERTPAWRALIVLGFLAGGAAAVAALLGYVALGMWLRLTLLEDGWGTSSGIAAFIVVVVVGLVLTVVIAFGREFDERGWATFAGVVVVVGLMVASIAGAPPAIARWATGGAVAAQAACTTLGGLEVADAAQGERVVAACAGAVSVDGDRVLHRETVERGLVGWFADHDQRGAYWWALETPTVHEALDGASFTLSADSVNCTPGASGSFSTADNPWRQLPPGNLDVRCNDDGGATATYHPTSTATETER